MMASASLVTFWACVNYFIATGIITEKSSFNRIAHGNLSQAQTEPCGQQLNSVRRPAWAAHWWIIIERKLPPSIGCLACEYQLCTLLWSCRTNRDHSTRHSDLKTLSIKWHKSTRYTVLSHISIKLLPKNTEKCHTQSCSLQLQRWC